MNILLTGATGYIGKRLLHTLLEEGHDITCCVRNKSRFSIPDGFESKINIIETDFSTPIHQGVDQKTKIDAAYYLIHSLSSSTKGYQQDELNTARHFKQLAEDFQCKQVIS